MSNDNQTRVFEIIANTLEIPAENVTLNLSIGSIPQWDSLGQLAIVSALEEAFGITFDVDELFEVESVADFIALIDKQVI